MTASEIHRFECPIKNGVWIEVQADPVAVGVGEVAAGIAEMLDQPPVHSRYQPVVFFKDIMNKSLTVICGSIKGSGWLLRSGAG